MYPPLAPVRRTDMPVRHRRPVAIARFASTALPRVPEAARLVERDAALTLIRARLQDAVHGKGHTLLIRGEAGIGKTSLLRQVAEEHPSIALWWGGCDALETPHPLAPLRDIARSANVGFAELLEAPSRRGDLFEAVMANLRASGPTLMVIEDAHWADESTLDLIKFIGRRIESVPAVLAVTFRDDEVTGSDPLRRVTGYLPPSRASVVQLPPLSPEAVEALAGRAMRPHQGLHELTRGNPFFLTEILQRGGDGIPRSVEDLVLARLAQLSRRSQRIVQLASIVPSRFERWLLDELLSPSVQALEACMNAGLLQADKDFVFFRHELARAAVEASLSLPMAQGLHASVLGALTRRGYAGFTPARLAHHAARAQDADEVRRQAPIAARLAIERGSHREAASHYRTVLAFSRDADPGEVLDWLEGYATECLATNDLGRAIEARERIAGMLAGREPLREGANASELAMLYVAALRNAEADEASRRALALLEALPPSVQLAKAYWVEAQLRMLDRDITQCARWAARAIEVAKTFDDKRVLAAAYGTLGTAMIFIDRGAGIVHLEHALEIALAEGFDYIAANSYSNLGTALGELFRVHDAVEYLRKTIEFAASKEIDLYRNYGMAWLALCDVLLGHWKEAESRALEVLSLSSEANTARVMALCALGKLRLRRGDAGVETVLDEALQLALASGTLQRIAPVRIARAEAAFMRGDLEQVVAESKAALEAVGSREHPWFVGEIAYWMRKGGAEEPPRARMAWPYVLQLSGRWRDAARVWTQLGCPYEAARALCEGDADAQLAALASFERLGARPAAKALRDKLRAARVRGLPRGVRSSTMANPRGLTDRELEVLGLLCAGLKNAEIALRLSRSVRTVDHHVDAVLRKLGARSRTEAVATATRDGLVSRTEFSAQ